MADVMGVPKSTYASYESGRRPLPPGFINKFREWQQQWFDFIQGIPQRVDEWLAVEGYGNGIPSAIKREDDNE